jgi:hypothetical protein
MPRKDFRRAKREPKPRIIKAVRFSEEQVDEITGFADMNRFTESAIIRVGTLMLLDRVKSGDLSIDELAEYARTT